MNNFKISSMVLAVSLVYSVNGLAQNLSKSEYKVSEKSIVSEYKSAKANCGSFSGNAKDICIAEAKGKEKIAQAELEARYKPSKKADYNVRVAKGEADTQSLKKNAMTNPVTSRTFASKKRKPD